MITKTIFFTIKLAIHSDLVPSKIYSPKLRMESNTVLLLTERDPWGMPTGGQTTFAKHLVIAFGSNLAVSSYCEDTAIPVGKWVKRKFQDTAVWFFNRGTFRRATKKKPLIPSRIMCYLNIRRFLADINHAHFNGLIIDSPEMLLAALPYKWESVCYIFAGVNNPVANSRYQLLRVFGGLFEKLHVWAIKRIKPDVILAAADQASVSEFHRRTKSKIREFKIWQFPTRVDTNIFKPLDLKKAREEIGFPPDHKVFVTVGRISWIKGWDLLLASFLQIRQKFPESLLVFVGDGEDFSKLISRAKEMGISDRVVVTGFLPQKKVNSYINSADVCFVGSYMEGWSVAMCEILATGKPIVATDVSGARELILEGGNGFIVTERDPELFAEAVYNSLKLNNYKEISIRISEKYSINNLENDLGKLWKPLMNRQLRDESALQLIENQK